MKEMPTESQVEAALAQFAYRGEIKSIRVCTQGHINDSYAITTTARKYFLQRVSPTAFKEPGQVMNNIILVTTFLRKEIIDRGGNPDEECLTLVPTKDGQEFNIDNEGRFWRLYLFIDGVVYDIPENPSVFGKAGEAF